MKRILLFSIMQLMLLTACAGTNPCKDQCRNMCFEINEISEDELFALSDVVITAQAVEIDEVICFNYPSDVIGYYEFTSYKIDQIEILKGDVEVSNVYLFDNSFDNDSAACTPEIMELGKTYKLYLEEIEGKYFSTAFLQSIIEL